MHNLQDNKSKSVLELTNIEARDFFLENSNYCTLDLPEYIDFSKILTKYKKLLEGKSYTDIKTEEKKNEPTKLDDVNHTILANKDGKLLWRPITLIHPAFYVLLVLEITTKETWELIKLQFKSFQKNTKHTCAGLPRYPIKSKEASQEKKHCNKKAQIEHWLEDVEQESIKLSLEYKYIFKTDITNCYGALYTHSIPWALHGKETAKNDTSDNLRGNVIDKYIRYMSYGQTNGIPQGSVLMDFIAEIVLGYADLKFSGEINQIEDYKIIRYRDDYRIFVNNREDGDKVLKILSDVLRRLGMSLNKEKTNSFDDIIHNSVKKCKLHMLNVLPEQDVQKCLLNIYELTLIYPNDGSIKTILMKFYKKLEQNKKRQLGNIKSLISIIVNIAYKNPILYDVCMGIFSLFLQKLEENNRRDIVQTVINRFKEIPNHGCLDLWLQRIILKVDENIDRTEEKLCKLLKNIKQNELEMDNNFLWNMNWLKSAFRLERDDYKTIFDQDSLNKLPPSISSDEINIFCY